MTLQLISVPVIIAVGVIVVRLVGELVNASDVWFSRWTEAPGLTFVARIVTVTWLALPVGGYFARRLMERGDGPRLPARAALVALAALLCLYSIPWLPFAGASLRIRWQYQGYVYSAVVLAAAAALWRAWPALARTMAAYAVLVGLALVTVISLAWTNGWGTHYDLQAPGPRLFVTLIQPASFAWAAFWFQSTVLGGLIAGSLTALAWRRSHPA